ncbi:hypothetical protein ACQKII_04345 [Lysinibacillus sp. NPDC048646]|uniref:hypothetical protein n=1 Tax=Lysinibacillus sp. NPDC048646 TaxID=3390574 RepID=UPI003D00D021
MGARWIKISVLYFAIALAFGLFMHYTVQLQWKATHAHIGVLGWLSTGFIGLIYSFYKEAAETALAKAQFWFYNIGLPFLLVGMMMVYLDVPHWLFEFCVSGGGIAVAFSAVLFVVNIFKHVKCSTN